MVRSLVIASWPPLPPALAVSGVHKRFGMFMNAIAKVSHTIEYLGMAPEVDVRTYDGPELSPTLSSYWGHSVQAKLAATRWRKENNWNHYGAGVFSAGAQPWFYRFSGPDQVASIRAALDSKPDLVFVSRLGAMLPMIRSGAKPARLFFDLDDIEHVANIRKSLARPRSIAKTLYCTHSLALLAAEREAARISDRTFVCSRKDETYLRRLGFGQKIKTVPNCVAIPALNEAECDTESLMFLGTYLYKPNVDAAHRLLTKIWPLILARRPSAKLIVAGACPERIPGFDMSLPGVEFTGLVQDLNALYARASVVACPLLVGAGTRLKLIEAGSFAKPMVSTAIGAEGLDLKDGADILIRDSDAEFADACCQLLANAALRSELGGAARAKVAATYNAETIEQDIADLFMA